mgnify:CR=1 FL=1
MAKKDELNFETDNKMASSEKLKALQAAMELSLIHISEPTRH